MLQKRSQYIILGNSGVFWESKITVCQNRLNSSSQNLNRVLCLFGSEQVSTRVFMMTTMRLFFDNVFWSSNLILLSNHGFARLIWLICVYSYVTIWLDAKAQRSFAEKFGLGRRILSPNICYFAVILRFVAILEIRTFWKSVLG